MKVARVRAETERTVVRIAPFPLHHVHHLCSRIPFYRLPLVLRRNPDLAKVGRLTLSQSFGCVRLVLWETRRLITFRELRTRFRTDASDRVEATSTLSDRR
jgi:fatty acid desaturase